MEIIIRIYEHLCYNTFCEYMEGAAWVYDKKAMGHEIYADAQMGFSMRVPDHNIDDDGQPDLSVPGREDDQYRFL